MQGDPQDQIPNENEPAEVQDAPDSARGEQSESEQEPAVPGDELQTLRDQLAEAEAKASENWDRALRATAEQDNIRKRAEREVSAARRFALEKFAQDLLAVVDSLELGLKAARDAGADESHIEGTELTSKMLADTLKRHGVESIDPQGESFNPDQHEAMTAVPNPDLAPNTVIEVMQKGYSLNERVLRPAMVVVSKAP